MSHFTVMVIGNNVEKQLAPFHEFECTGINDEYVIDVDVTEESIAYGNDKETGTFDLTEALSYHGLEDKIVTDEADVDRDGKHKFGYAVVKDGILIKAVNRTNPNKKWDWYLVGGRWTGFFKMKDGRTGRTGEPGIMTELAKEGYADSALKKYIDFEFMRNDAGQKAAAKWDRAHELMGDSVISFVPWDTVRDEIHKGNIYVARRAYQVQPARQALNTDDNMRWENVEEFLCTRFEYIQKAQDSAFTTFAVVKDGVWYERGNMGWWGIVTNEEDRDTWNSKFSELIDSLPDDTLLTVVDCHI